MVWKLFKAFGKGVNEGGAQFTATVTNPAGSALGTAVNAAAKGAEKGAGGLGYGLGRVGLRAPLKGAGIAALVGAAVVGVGVVASRIRSGRAKASREELRDARDAQQDAAIAQEMAALQQQNTMMGLEPTPGAHAQRVQMGRAGVTQLGAVNPDMNVVPEGSVQNLNSPSR